MNKWYLRLQVILCVGGGFMGCATTLFSFFKFTSIDVFAYLPFPFAEAFFVYSIVVGILVSERPDYRHYLAFLYAPQVVAFYSPILSYQVSSGLELFVGIRNGSPIYHVGLGGLWYIWMLKPSAWVVGINVFALMAVIIEVIIWMKKLSSNSKAKRSMVNDSPELTPATPDTPV